MSAGSPDEAGGALFNTGAMEIMNTVFKENTAMDGGLAIQSLESAVVVLRNVTFDGNILSCPSETYSYTQEVSTSTVSVHRLLHSVWQANNNYCVYPWLH